MTKCPKTLSGKHYWNINKETGSYIYIDGEPPFAKCIACGIYKDMHDDEIKAQETYEVKK